MLYSISNESIYETNKINSCTTHIKNIPEIFWCDVHSLFIYEKVLIMRFRFLVILSLVVGFVGTVFAVNVDPYPFLAGNYSLYAKTSFTVVSGCKTSANGWVGCGGDFSHSQNMTMSYRNQLRVSGSLNLGAGWSQIEYKDSVWIKGTTSGVHNPSKNPSFTLISTAPANNFQEPNFDKSNYPTTSDLAGYVDLSKPITINTTNPFAADTVLVPGSYGDVAVNSDYSVLILKGGTYYFNSLRVDTKIEIDKEVHETTRIVVRDQFTVSVSGGADKIVEKKGNYG